MNKDNLIVYSNEVPEQIKLVIKGMDSEVRLAIIVALMKREKMSFSELKELLDINSSSLSRHLSILQDGGLVTNVLGWKENSYSYYTITDIAKSVLGSLFDIVVQIPTSISTSQSEKASLEIRDKSADSNQQIAVSEFIDLAVERQYATEAISSVAQYTTVNKDFLRRFQNKQVAQDR